MPKARYDILKKLMQDEIEIKMLCDIRECLEVQNLAFSLGICWISGGQNIKAKPSYIYISIEKMSYADNNRYALMCHTYLSEYKASTAREFSLDRNPINQ